MPRFGGEPVKPRFSGEIVQTPEVSKAKSFATGLSPIGQVGLEDELFGAGYAVKQAAAEGRLPTKDDFQKGKDFRQSQQQIEREANPAAALAGDITGAVGVGLMAPSSTIMGGVKSAAALGGLTGFGRAEGDLIERSIPALQNAAGSAFLSGVLGTATKVVPIVWNSGKKFTGQVWDSLATNGDDIVKAADRASKKVISAFQEDKITPDVIERAIKNGGSIFDATGRSGKTLAETAALYNGGREATEEFFTQRAGGTAARLKQSISDFVSRRMDYEYLADDITNAGRKSASELYEKAYAVKPKITQEIKEILDTPAGKKAIQNANELALNEQKNLDELGFELLDYVKRGFDIEINKFKDPLGRLNLDDNGRAIVSLRSALNEQMKDINPDYKKATEVAGDYLSNVEAINKGLKFTKYTPKELKEIVSELTESEKTSFLAGVAGSLRSRIDDATTKNLAARAIPNETVKQQLKSVLGDGEYTKLLKSIAAEEDFYRAQDKILRGSQTAARQSFRKSFEADADFSQAANSRGILDMGIGWTVNQIKKAADGLNDKTAKQVADMLYETNPEKQLEILNRMKKAADAGDYEARLGLDVYAGFTDAVKNVLRVSLPVNASSAVVTEENKDGIQ